MIIATVKVLAAVVVALIIMNEIRSYLILTDELLLDAQHHVLAVERDNIAIQASPRCSDPEARLNAIRLGKVAALKECEAASVWLRARDSTEATLKYHMQIDYDRRWYVAFGKYQAMIELTVTIGILSVVGYIGYCFWTRRKDDRLPTNMTPSHVSRIVNREVSSALQDSVLRQRASRLTTQPTAKSRLNTFETNAAATIGKDKPQSTLQDDET